VSSALGVGEGAADEGATDDVGAGEDDAGAGDDDAGAGEDATGMASEVLLAPTVTVCTRVVVCNWILVSTAVTVMRSGAVGHMLKGVVLLKEIVGVTDGTDEPPVGNDEVVTFSDGLGVSDGTDEPPVGNEKVVMLSDGLGVNDGTEEPPVGNDEVVTFSDGLGVNDGTEEPPVGNDEVVTFSDGLGVNDGTEEPPVGNDEVVTFSDGLGVSDGTEEPPVGNEEVVTFSDGLGVTDGIDELPVGANEEVVPLNEGLGVTDGMLITFMELDRVTMKMLLELLGGGTKEDAPVGALVVFEISVKTPELGLGVTEDVELTETGGRVDDAAVGNLVVELLEGVGIPEDEPIGKVKVLGNVAEVLTFTGIDGVMEERLKDPDLRSSEIGGPVEVVFRPGVDVLVGGTVMVALDEGTMIPELPNEVVRAELVS